MDQYKDMLENKFCSNIAPSASTGPPHFTMQTTHTHSENSEIGHFSCFIEFFAFFHIVSDRYTSD